MAKSKNFTSGQQPLMGTSVATSATAAKVYGARPTPKKGIDKSGDPTRVPHDLKGRRATRAGTNGAQYGVSVSRAFPARAEGATKQTHNVPASHNEYGSWSQAYAEFSNGAMHGRA
jgi:hypothetical protein